MFLFCIAMEFPRIDKHILATISIPSQFFILLLTLLTDKLQDIFIIATSSCARFMPSRRGYSALSISANGNSQGRGRNNRAEDENRLIDQLDEEWDD